MSVRRACALGVALVACAPGGAAPDGARLAITAASPAPDDEAVVALVAGGIVGCSGTYVAPRVVLTAAHCLVGRRVDEVRVGAHPAEGLAVAVRRAIQHPGFDRFTLDHDLALLVTDPAPIARPARLPDGPLDLERRALRLVGFGLTAIDDPAPPERRQGSSAVAVARALDFTFAPAPSQTCAGDSGGPAFVVDADGGERLAGVTSAGDRACARFGRDVRVDAYLDFVAPFLPGARATGEPCVYDEQCAAGACLVPDDTTLAYCSARCAVDDECPAPMACGDGSCRHPLPSPGALGAACLAHEQCEHGLCAGGACSRLCFRDDPASCPAGYRCAPGSPDACVAEAAAGCALAPRGGPAPALVLATLAVARARRRHRRRPRP